VASLMMVIHNAVLPFMFYAIIFAHIAAVLKHHFLDQRTADIRRMLA
jgi:cytochrome b561